MDFNEELEGLLRRGVCRKCNSEVVFAYSKPLEYGIETKRCLSCGQVYTRDKNWKEVGEKEG
jgi:uncharacterized protein with PIN domain